VEPKQRGDDTANYLVVVSDKNAKGSHIQD
jgi:hypothetical protein